MNDVTIKKLIDMSAKIKRESENEIRRLSEELDAR